MEIDISSYENSKWKERKKKKKKKEWNIEASELYFIAKWQNSWEAQSVLGLFSGVTLKNKTKKPSENELNLTFRNGWHTSASSKPNYVNSVHGHHTHCYSSNAKSTSSDLCSCFWLNYSQLVWAVEKQKQKQTNKQTKKTKRKHCVLSTKWSSASLDTRTISSLILDFQNSKMLLIF